MFKDLELRKMPAGSLCSIASILEMNNDWKKVMANIPKNPQSKTFEPKYNSEHIRLIENYAQDSGRICAEILFDEWGTSGRIRPTLGTLQDVVIKAQVFRAADEIASMLKEPPPLRPREGPAATISTNITIMLNDESLDVVSGSANLIPTYNEKIHNDTTAQMRSSNLIKFSNNFESKELPKISDLQSMGDETTAELKSESNLIKFSITQLTNIDTEESELDSKNIPNLTAIMNDTKDIQEPSTKVIRSSIQTNTNLSEISSYIQTESSIRTDISSSAYQQSLPNIDLPSISSGIDSLILHNTDLIHFSYKELEAITNNFSENLISDEKGSKGKIGSGGFGAVFAGFHPRYGPLAVKRAHNNLQLERKPDIAVKVFNAEVKYLSQFKHDNIVPIIGFSKDGPSLCIVCEYIDGGSLEEKLAQKIMNEKQRLNIMLGTAEGLKYLHRSEKTLESDGLVDNIESDSNSVKKNNFVHGDVKSANILLTKDCIPKLCDFGLAKQFDSTFITTSPMGTSAYMAPEGFSGTITQKIDIYSYGIVLLELLTGLRPIVSNNSEKINIKDYIEENCIDHDISRLLDSAVDKWTKAEDVYNLARSCLERERKSRPSIEDICDILKIINNS